MRPYRRERIATVIRNTIAEAIVHKMQDPRLTPLTGVTRVEVSADLQIARVYLSVPGTDAAERKTMAAMQHAVGYLQSMVAGRLQIRQCPELRFALDEGVKKARETMQLLDENLRQDPSLGDVEHALEPPPEPGTSHAAGWDIGRLGEENRGSVEPDGLEGTGA